MLFGIFVEHFLRMKQISVLFLACMGLLSHTANAQSNNFAAQFQAGMMQMPTSEATIVSLTDDTLVLRESESGAEVTYERS